MHVKCPNCSSRDVGKIGSNQFYCWGCFIELNVVGDKVSVFQVEEDGTLSSLEDLFPAGDTDTDTEVQLQPT